ncbi:hypothetical protein PXY73_004623, partial [Salmonella enterica]|nr:hypothetical protein [Salmonella enterica]
TPAGFGPYGWGLMAKVNGRLAATVPVTPPLARCFLRFSHPGGKAAGL